MSEEKKEEAAPAGEQPQEKPQEKPQEPAAESPAEPQAEAPKAEGSEAAPEAPKEEEKPPAAETIEGKVKWFSNVKGYGFLQAEGQDRDIFVHYSSIQSEGYKTLTDSEEVTFEVVQSEKGPQAARVVRKKKEADKEGKKDEAAS